MKRAQIVLGYMVLIGVALMSSRAWAENEGRADLDEATQLKVTAGLKENARRLPDLEKVVTLCESALEKGLDEGNTQFAKQLLSSTLYEYAEIVAGAIFRPGLDNQRRIALRQVAMKQLEKAVKHDPGLGDAQLLLAQLQAMQSSARDEAIESLAKAIEAFTKEGGTDAEEADNRKKLSRAYAMRAKLVEDEDDKVADARRAIEADPTNQEAQQTLAMLYLSSGKYQEASDVLEKLLESDPENQQFLAAVCEVLINLKQYDKALEHIDRAIGQKPDNAANYAIRARIHAAKEDYPNALKDLDKALEQNPDDVATLLYRARIHLTSDDVQKARTDIDRVLQLQPNSAQALLLRSMIASAEKRFAAAIADIRKLLQVDPDNAGLRLQMGGYYSASGRPRKAVEIFTEILQDDPDNLIALRSRGDALLSYGQHAEAIKDYEKGLKIDPKHSGILNNLAWVLATSTEDQLRDGQRSITLAKQACEETEYKAAHILSTLAAAYAESGDFESAIKWADKAVEAGSGSDVEEHLRKELESYRKGEVWREKQETEEKPELSTSDLET